MVVPLVVVPMIAFGRREKRLSRTAQERIADLSDTAEETINGLRAVQAFTHEAVDRARYSVQIESSVAAALRRIGTRALLILAVILLGFGAVTFSLWVGGRDVIEGRMTGGELSAFVLYAVMLATSGASLSEVWGEVQRAAGAAERLLELLAQRPAIAAPAAPLAAAQPDPRPHRLRGGHLPLPDPAGPPRARSASPWWWNPARRWRWSAPRAPARPPCCSCCCASTTRSRAGCGWTGWTSPRWTRPRCGRASAWCRRTPSSSAPRRGRTSASAGRMRPMPRSTPPSAPPPPISSGALPQGLDTHLGTKGVMLSGGQRQRVAIARAILRDPAVLLLDEATSALDAESEQAVQHALTVLARDRTTLVVAHRLATVRRADRIIVLEAGRIVATGTHEALVREGGLYGRLAALQFG